MLWGLLPKVLNKHTRTHVQKRVCAHAAHTLRSSKQSKITLQLSVPQHSALHWFILKVKMGKFQQGCPQRVKRNVIPPGKKYEAKSWLTPKWNSCHSESNGKPHVKCHCAIMYWMKKIKNDQVTNVTHWGLWNAKWRWVSNLSQNKSLPIGQTLFRIEENGTVQRQGPLHPLCLSSEPNWVLTVLLNYVPMKNSELAHSSKPPPPVITW